MPGGGCALPGLRAVSARSATIRAGQAQRRPATGSRLCCRLNARWRLRLTGPTAVSPRSVTIQAGQAQRRPAMGISPAMGSRLCCRLTARWRLRLTGPTGCFCLLRNDPGRASVAPPGNGHPDLAAAVGRPPARGYQKRQMEMVICRLANDKINLRPGKNALAPDAGKPRPRFRG